MKYINTNKKIFVIILNKLFNYFYLQQFFFSLLLLFVLFLLNVTVFFFFSLLLLATGFFSSSTKFGSRYLLPIALKRSSIPAAVYADVSLNMAPISYANPLASASGTCSFSNKSDLFAAIATIVFLGA